MPTSKSTAFTPNSENLGSGGGSNPIVLNKRHSNLLDTFAQIRKA
jgi:hypothetical protein